MQVQAPRQKTHKGSLLKYSKVASQHLCHLDFIAVAVTAIAGTVHWNFLPPGDRYIWPVSADDWAAWGTWASAFGAIGAVYFAAQSIKHTIEAQKALKGS